MKVLILCKKPPSPPTDGETIAIDQMIKSHLDLGNDVTVWALYTEKHPLPKDFKVTELPKVDYYYHEIDTRLSFLKAGSNLFGSLPYLVKRFYNIKAANHLKEILKLGAFEVVQFEGAALGVYLNVVKQNSNAKTVLRAHNVEHRIWEGLAEEEKGRLSKFYLKQVMNPRFKKFEENVLKNVDGVMAISNADEKNLKLLSNIEEIETVGVYVESIGIAVPLPESFEAGFIGDMQWQPNLLGFKRFVSWWNQFAESKDASLHLAGRNTALFKDEVKSFTCHGEVKLASDYVNSLSVVVVPLWSGSGIKIKVLESMSLGRAVITTDVGAEGIDAVDGEDIVIANSAEEWKQALIDLHNNPDKRQAIGDAGKNFVNSMFSRKSITQKLGEFLNKL